MAPAGLQRPLGGSWLRCGGHRTGDIRAALWKPTWGWLARLHLTMSLHVGVPVLPGGLGCVLGRTRVQERETAAGRKRLHEHPLHGRVAASQALPGHTAQTGPRDARRGEAASDPVRDLPWSEAGRLGPRRRVQSFPRLGRFLSVHLLQDRVQFADHVCFWA